MQRHERLRARGERYRRELNELIPGMEALRKAGLAPVTLGAKEGLALTSGTTSVTAMAVLALYNSMQAEKTAYITGAMSLEVLKGTIKAFDPRPHSLKKHEEQAKTARNVSRILEGSQSSRASSMFSRACRACW